MLQTQFAFKGQVFRGNRIPESWLNLQEAAHKIMEIHFPEYYKKAADFHKRFHFTYELPKNPASKDKKSSDYTIFDDQSLMNALN